MTDHATAAQPSACRGAVADLPKGQIATLDATHSRPARTGAPTAGAAGLQGARAPQGGEIGQAPRAVAPLRSTEWMGRARCRNHPPEVFFPDDGDGVETARRICEACPVNDACLDYALVNRIDHGVWGGTSERARRRMLRARHHEGEQALRSARTQTGARSIPGPAPRQSNQAKSATSNDTLQGGNSHVRPS
jgi:WhiB family redox-sensing transcriptional regulator